MKIEMNMITMELLKQIGTKIDPKLSERKATISTSSTATVFIDAVRKRC